MLKIEGQLDRKAAGFQNIEPYARITNLTNPTPAIFHKSIKEHDECEDNNKENVPLWTHTIHFYIHCITLPSLPIKVWILRKQTAQVVVKDVHASVGASKMSLAALQDSVERLSGLGPFMLPLAQCKFLIVYC